jgi:hypothetical protein
MEKLPYIHETRYGAPYQSVDAELLLLLYGWGRRGFGRCDAHGGEELRS